MDEQVQIDHKTKFYSSALFKGLLGCAIVAFLLMKLDFLKVVQALQSANYGYLSLGLMFIVLSRTLLAWQTATAIRHYDVALSTARAFVINHIVNFYSLFLPSGLTGGVIKWYRFSQHAGKKAEVLAAIVSIKIVNLTFMLTIGVLALAFENPFDEKIMHYAVLVLFLAIAFVVFISCAQSLPGIATVCNHLLCRLPDSITKRVHKLWNALNYFKELPPLQLFYFLVVPPLVLCSVTILYYLTALSLGLKLPFSAMIWTGAMVFIIEHIPASISGLGLREGALVLLLPMYGVLPSQAMAFSLILFGYVLVMGLLGGLFEVNEQFIKPKSSGDRLRPH